MDSRRNQLAAMSGGGNTRLEALEEVRKNFDRFKATGKKLPRPGTKVPIEFVLETVLAGTRN